MSYIQQTIRCKNCFYEMNIATGTFGSGVPNDCPNCRLPLECDVLSYGWNANNDDTLQGPSEGNGTDEQGIIS